MLAGARGRLHLYASAGSWYSLTLEEPAASAQSEVARVMAVRDAVGASVAIMTDATETWSVTRALRTSKALQDAGVVWIEDPVSHTDIAGMARVTAALDVPV